MDRITFRMSESGHCPRALSAQVQGIEPAAKPDWLEDAAQEGNWHEIRIKQMLQFEGYEVFNDQKELEIVCPNIRILGHIDGMVRRNGRVQLLEVKSMSQYEFDRWMRGRFNEFPEYAAQITCYMARTVSDVLYIVKNRNSGYIDRMEFITPPVKIEALLKSLDNIATAGGLMPAEPDFGTLRCKRCEYKQLCVKTKEDMTIQDEQILTQAAIDWREGSRLIHDGTELADKAKEIFKEHSIAANLKKWKFDDLLISLFPVKRESYDKKELLKLFTIDQLSPALKISEYDTLRIDDLKEQ